MENIKTKRPERPSFWTYFLVLNKNINAEGATTAAGRQLVFDMYAVLISIFLFLALIGNLGFSALPETAILSFLFVYVLAILCMSIQRKPTLYSLMPMGHIRKTVYFFLSAALMTIISMIALAVVGGIFAGIIGLVVVIASGENIFVAGEAEGAEEVILACTQGEWLGFFIAIAFAGIIILLSFIGKRPLRICLTLAAPLVIYLPLKIYQLLCKMESGMLFAKLYAYPSGIAVLAIAGVVGCALAVAGVLRVYYYLRPKKY